MRFRLIFDVCLLHLDVGLIVSFTDRFRTDYAGYADKIEGDVYPPEDGSYNFVQYEPLGVVACISAWNATYLYVNPFRHSDLNPRKLIYLTRYYAWKIAPALAAGNTVRDPIFLEI